MKKRLYVKIRYIFRIWNLIPTEAEIIKSKLPHNRIEISPYYCNKKKRVISMPINKRFDSNQVKQLISKLKIDSNQYGVYVSIVSERDWDGVRLPEPVRLAVFKLGGHIDFSYTCVQ